jgi:hypothetical protein
VTKIKWWRIARKKKFSLLKKCALATPLKKFQRYAIQNIMLPKFDALSSDLSEFAEGKTHADACQ